MVCVSKKYNDAALPIDAVPETDRPLRILVRLLPGRLRLSTDTPSNRLLDVALKSRCSPPVTFPPKIVALSSRKEASIAKDVVGVSLAPDNRTGLLLSSLFTVTSLRMTTSASPRIEIRTSSSSSGIKPVLQLSGSSQSPPLELIQET